MSGLDWFPMRKRSRKPFVTTKACFAPFLSSRAFVATVVESLSASTESAIAVSKGYEEDSPDVFDFASIEFLSSRDRYAENVFEYTTYTFRRRIRVVVRIDR